MEVCTCFCKRACRKFLAWGNSGLNKPQLGEKAQVFIENLLVSGSVLGMIFVPNEQMRKQGKWLGKARRGGGKEAFEGTQTSIRIHPFPAIFTSCVTLGKFSTSVALLSWSR